MRTRRPEVAPLPAPEGSVLYAPGTIKRDKISLPTELLSTTNMHALNAPDIRSVSASSSKSSLRSTEGSEFSHIDRSFLESPMTTPDTSSIESSPTAPEHIRQGSFFEQKTRERSVSSSGTSRSTKSTSSILSAEVPSIPQRALSHSKHAHQELARKRSISRLSPPPSSLPSANSVRDSAAFFNGSMDSSHPFGKELAQVAEVAEEFGAVSSVLEKEEELLVSKGLLKFSVDDYINEIQGLYGGVYEDRLAHAWI